MTSPKLRLPFVDLNDMKAKAKLTIRFQHNLDVLGILYPLLTIIALLTEVILTYLSLRLTDERQK